MEASNETAASAGSVVDRPHRDDTMTSDPRARMVDDGCLRVDDAERGDVMRRVHLPLLSKSRYVYGVQCDKRLYLDCHEPELVGEPSAGLQRLFDQGHEVGELATRRYPGGVRIENDRDHYAEAAEATARVIADPDVPAIFEAPFEYAGVRVRVDVLARKSGGWWRVEEVKSSTAYDERVHLQDLAVQLFVLESCGMRVSEAGILHVDSAYLRTTAEIDVDQMFAFVELRKDARALRREIVANLRRWRRQLVRLGAPAVDPGRHCYEPHECPFTEHCIEPSGRFSLRRLPAPFKVMDAVAARAPDDVRKLPDDVSLSKQQRRAVECIVAGREHVDPSLGSALAAVKYPLHFLDFETFAPAIPRYRWTRPYQQLPFQWSCHVVHSDGRVEHLEHLHTSDSDPRARFLDSLLDALGRSGTIVVYSSFEKTQLNALARVLRNRRKRIRALKRRLLDLHAVVKAHYYHPDLDGSFSLKALVPVLAPEIAYGEIADGQDAGAAYVEMIAPATEPARRAALERELRCYCRTDTLATVEVWKALERRAAAAR
jgi:hypothetical protein